MYFETNLPEKAPAHVKDHAAIDRINAILDNIHTRMNKLEEALIRTGLPGEQFAEGAKILFHSKSTSGESMLDVMTPEEIAEFVAPIAKNMDYQERLEWPNATVVVDTAFLHNDEWEAIRTIGMGGSDAAVAIGVSPYRTEQQLYYDKIGTQFKIQENDPGKEFIFSYGHKVEPLVIEEFCRRTGAEVIKETRMFAKKDMPFLTANIDGFLKLADGSYCLFEAKTTTTFNRAAWEDDHVPAHYVAQCRQYMGVLDDPRISDIFIGCIYGNTPNDFVCRRIDRDLERETIQFESEQEFWEDFVLEGVEPPPSGDPKKDIAIVKNLSGYADKTLPEIELEPELRTTVEEYLELDKERKNYEKKSKTLKERQSMLSLGIIKALGTVTKGRLDKDAETDYEISYSPKSRTSVDTEKLGMLYPDAYRDCVSVNPESTRVFGIKEKKKKKK